MDIVGTTFAERLACVKQRVADAARRVARDPDEISIVAVSKRFGPDAVRAASESGQIVFGENRVQEARQKIPLCPSHLEWHMIGHLQGNKIRDAVRLFSFVHSVDSVRLLEALDAACGEACVEMPIFLEVNVSGEASKFGVNPDELPLVLERTTSLLNLQVIGLMTMPPLTEDPEGARPFFAKLRELRDRCGAEAGIPLPELSMGMTHDFDVAVEEGATWIRLGSVLFGPRSGG